MNLSEKSTIDLVNLYGNILSELNSRGVVRTYNSPVGDYAEWLVSHKLGLNLERNSPKGYDAYLEQDKVRITYQIKSRWEHGAPSAKTRKLSVLRDVGENAFHYLIAVIFGPHFEIREAWQIPVEVLGQYLSYSRHVNGYLLTLAGPILRNPAVLNIRDLLK